MLETFKLNIIEKSKKMIHLIKWLEINQLVQILQVSDHLPLQENPSSAGAHTKEKAFPKGLFGWCEDGMKMKMHLMVVHWSCLVALISASHAKISCENSVKLMWIFSPKFSHLDRCKIEPHKMWNWAAKKCFFSNMTSSIGSLYFSYFLPARAP